VLIFIIVFGGLHHIGIDVHQGDVAVIVQIDLSLHTLAGDSVGVTIAGSGGAVAAEEVRTHGVKGSAIHTVDGNSILLALVNDHTVAVHSEGVLIVVAVIVRDVIQVALGNQGVQVALGHLVSVGSQRSVG